MATTLSYTELVALYWFGLLNPTWGVETAKLYIVEDKNTGGKLSGWQLDGEPILLQLEDFRRLIIYTSIEQATEVCRILNRYSNTDATVITLSY